MITILSLSPAIDKRVELERIVLGQTNRVVKTHSEGAGKGIDVALALGALEVPAHCIGILPKRGEPVTDRLKRNNISYDFLPAPGEVRINQKLQDRISRMITEINEPCPEAPLDLLESAMDQAVEAAKGSDYLVLTGSLPKCCPTDLYAQVIMRVHQAAPQCRCVLDADGEQFAKGIQARPWLVKPNLHELEQATGGPLHSREEILEAARRLCRSGPEIVVVSMGSEGALAISAEDAYFCGGISAAIRTTTGAGDAMIGGLLCAFHGGASLTEALCHGVAAATSRCVYGGDAFIDAALYRQFLQKAIVRRASAPSVERTL